MSEHPPIPPNCKEFDKYNDECGWRFNLPSDGGEFVWLEDTFGWRRIIAAVARCAWLDEAVKLNTKEPLYYVYQKHSEAWRVWGEL